MYDVLMSRIKLEQETIAQEEQKAQEKDFNNFISTKNVNTGGKVFDSSTDSASSIENNLNVSKGGNQTKFLERVLSVSKTWGKEKNGTIVDFNYGAVNLFGNNKGNYFVFYDGKWYETNYTKWNVPDHFHANLSNPIENFN